MYHMVVSPFDKQLALGALVNARFVVSNVRRDVFRSPSENLFFP